MCLRLLWLQINLMSCCCFMYYEKYLHRIVERWFWLCLYGILLVEEKMDAPTRYKTSTTSFLDQTFFGDKQSVSQSHERKKNQKGNEKGKVWCSYCIHNNMILWFFVITIWISLMSWYNDTHYYCMQIILQRGWQMYYNSTSTILLLLILLLLIQANISSSLSR